MEAQIGRELEEARMDEAGADGAGAADDGRALALDLSASEIVLHEGSPSGGWRRFAGVALDDPEFLEVIALLREEAEGEVGRGRPVTLWLPGEQVLRLSARLDGPDAEARRAAAFRIASRETGHGPEELAVALGPAGAGGETPLLVTYAATWREARGYAERWGFVPGSVSTRHHAEEFGPKGPEFRVGGPAGEAQGAAQGEARGEARGDAQPRLAWLAVGLAALVATLPGAAAAKGPAAAPVPEVRAVALAAADAAPAETLDPGPAVPLARPEEPDAVAEPTQMRGEPSATPPAPAAESTAEAAGGGAAPLPSPRPARAAGAEARKTGTAVAAAGGGFLPPVRPPDLAPGLRPDRVALIGILNLDTGREALLRLPNGEFVTVRTGEVLDGWEIAAIGPETMQVRRGTRTLTLVLVSP